MKTSFRKVEPSFSISMEKLTRIVKEFVLPAASLLFPFVALAQVPAPPVSAPNSGINSSGAITSTLCTVINWLFYLLIVLAVIMVLVAAFKYLTAAGDPEKVKSASHTLLYAAVAIVVAIIAKAFPSLIGSFIGSGSQGVGC
jgi:heme/copper-type cytochrome/quinol oxidase subunit 2